MRDYRLDQLDRIATDDRATAEAHLVLDTLLRARGERLQRLLSAVLNELARDHGQVGIARVRAVRLAELEEVLVVLAEDDRLQIAADLGEVKFFDRRLTAVVAVGVAAGVAAGVGESCEAAVCRSQTESTNAWIGGDGTRGSRMDSMGSFTLAVHASPWQYVT